METIDEAAEKYFNSYSYSIDENTTIKEIAKDNFKAGVEIAQRWIPIEEELPPPSNDESGFGDILSEYVIIKDENNNYDIKRYDHLAMRWTGSRNVIPKFWRPINLK